MTDHLGNFAQDFTQATHEKWHNLALKALRGVEFSSLETLTEDGIKRGPLFTQNSAVNSLQIAPSPQPNFMDRHWHIETLIGHPSVSHANQELLTDLKGGASAALLCIDPSSKNGITVQSKADLQALLTGIHANLIPISLLPSDDNFHPAALLAAHFSNDKQLPDINISLGYAPILLTSATRNNCVALAKWVIKHAPHWRVLAINARLAHEQGASPAQELAFMLSMGCSYIRILLKSGLSIGQILPLLDIYLSSDQDSHQGIIKFRAARALWAKLAQEFGASEAQQHCHIHAISSERMMGSQDPWSNMIRLSSASFGAVCGGADHISILPFTQPLGLAPPFARRVSRNLQLLQMEESHLGHVQDPASGSYMHSALTQELSEKAWEIFQSMEGLGGWPKCKTWFHRLVAKTHKLRMAKIKSGDTLLVGVNQFAKPDIRKAEVLPRPRIKHKPGQIMAAKRFTDLITEANSGALIPALSTSSGFIKVSLTAPHENKGEQNEQP